MNFRKWVCVIMAAVLLLSVLSGCGAAPQQEEESAAAGDYVAEEPSSKPEKEESTSKGPAKVEGTTSDKLITLPDQKPEEQPEQETPEEQPKEEDPAEPPKEEASEVIVEEGNLLKIVDYNVRCADDGPGKMIAERSVRFGELMKRLDPDIMGLQEVTPPWLTYLEENFGKDYEIIHRWRAASSQEGTPILFKKDRFKKLDSGYFWLSDTPNRESKAENWGSEHYRICMWVKLRVKATGKDFLYFNTHFDFKETCHVNSAELILTEVVKQKGFGKYAVFCSGDYNMGATGKGHQAMCRKFSDINQALNNDKTPTTNGYNETTGGSIIDFVFYSPKLVKPVKYQVLNEKIDGGYISDHRGIYVEAALI